MDDFQDGQQHNPVEDWPKLRDIQFSLQVFNNRAMAATFAISGNGSHPRWQQHIHVQLIFSFTCRSLSLMVEP